MASDDVVLLDNNSIKIGWWLFKVKKSERCLDSEKFQSEKLPIFDSEKWKI